MNVADLLELVFFIATQGAGEFGGADISLKFDNYQLHRYLIQAVKVFDEWALNYYKFIEWWILHDKQYCVSKKQVYSAENQLAKNHNEYELFNYVLHYYLGNEKFDFMRQELMIYLKTIS